MIEFTIPYEIPSQNKTDRQHWAVRAREVKRLTLMIRCSMPRCEPATGPRKVTITAYRKRLITDDANFRGGAKRLMDSLVKVGLLVDDSDRWTTIEYTQKLSRMHPGDKICTDIAITDFL